MYISTISYPFQQKYVSFASKKLSDSGFISKTDLIKELDSGVPAEKIAQKYCISIPRLCNLAKAFGLYQKLTANSPINQFNVNTGINRTKNSVKGAQVNLDTEIPKLIEKNATIEQMQQALGVKKYWIIKWIKLNTPNGLRQLKKERLKNLYMSELSNKELAQLMGVPLKNVSTKRPKYGVFMSKRKEEKILEQVKKALNSSVKIKDIAKEANVHVQTCSRYIQKYNLMPEKTENQREFILQKIKEGKGKYAVAKELQISESAFLRLLDKLNLKDAFEQHKQKLQQQVQEQRKNGIKIKEVAQNLGISERTVLNYTKKR